MLYFATVKLTLAATLPLPFAHLLWPAAGIALLCALRWGGTGAIGAGLGHILADVTAFIAVGSGPLDPPDFGLVTIARPCAVTLQAYAAYWLQNRFTLTTASLALTPLRPLLRALIVGPGACLIGATTAALTLPAGNPSHGADRVYWWLTFWVGDSLAAIGVLPLASLLGWTRRLEPSVIGFSRTMVALTLSLCLLGWLAAAYVHTAWLERAQSRFATEADEFQSRFQGYLNDGRLMLVSLGAFFGSSDEVTAREFENFSSQLLGQDSEHLSLGWIEAEARSPARLALRFAYPPGSAQPDRNFLDDAEFAAGFRRAQAKNRVQAVPNADFSRRGPDVAASVLLLPVYDSRESGRRAIAGFVAAALNLERIAAALQPQGRGPMQSASIRVTPSGESSRPALLSVWSTADGLRPLPHRALEPALPGFIQHRSLQAGDVAWTLTLALPRSHAYYLTEPSWWIGPILVQLLATLLAGSLLLARAEAMRGLEQRLGGLWQRLYASEPDTAAHPAAPAPVPPPVPAPGAGTERLRRALSDDEFVTHFQPIVNLQSGRVEGVEALLRWPDAPEGLEIPAVIEWAERSGTIVELGERVLHKALGVLARWRQNHGYTGWMAVNISAMQLHDPDWVDTTLTALRQANVPGHCLVLEITESVLIRTASVSPQIAKLREAGIHVSLDDFGVGYSSMAYLHRLPVDQLKLDRSFIAGLGQDPVAQEIVRTVVSLAKALKLEVTAEGVEDAATARLLRTLGCALAQGWLFSRAVDEATATGVIQRGFDPPG